MKKIFISFLFMVATGASHGACNSDGCIGVGAEAFISMLPNSSGTILIQTPVATRDNLQCTLWQGQHILLTRTNPLFKEIYATLLFALSAEKTVQVRVKPNSNPCEVFYVRVFS